MGDTTEQLTLIGFAAHLGTCVSHEDGMTNEGDLRSEAQLLMNLLVSNESKECKCEESNEGASPTSVAQSSTQRPRPVTEAKSCAFTFSCPSLSLDGKPKQPHLPRHPLRPTTGTQGSIPSQAPSPAVTMGRPLVVDDRDAIRLSAEAMARNILRTFEKAVKWRKQCWVDTLARPLMDQERNIKARAAVAKSNGKSQAKEELKLKTLLETPEAKVIASLNKAKIQVMDARTSFRVLSQRWDNKNNSGMPPAKKRKVIIDGTGNAIAMHSQSEQYSTAYVLSFQTVLNLSSPAGYSQVTLEAPGIIKGTFITSPKGDATLTGVSVQVDTSVLATMIEKSSRIVARASAQVILTSLQKAKTHSDSKGHTHVDVQVASPCPDTTTQNKSPRRVSTTENDDSESFVTTIVTPGYGSPPNVYCDNDSDPELVEVEKTYIPLPDDLDATNHRRAFLRMVSPQPGSGSSDDSLDVKLERNPRRNMSSIKRAGPSLVSPPLSTRSHEYLTFDPKQGPSLPALLEVACAAMMHT